MLGRGRFEQGWFWSSWQVSAQSQGERRLGGRGGRVQGEAKTTCSLVATWARARVLMVVHICLVWRACRVAWVARSAIVWDVSHCGRLQIPSGTRKALGRRCHCLQILHVRQQKWGSWDYKVRGASRIGQQVTYHQHITLTKWVSVDASKIQEGRCVTKTGSQLLTELNQMPVGFQKPYNIQTTVFSPTVDNNTYTQ